MTLLTGWSKPTLTGISDTETAFDYIDWSGGIIDVLYSDAPGIIRSTDYGHTWTNLISPFPDGVVPFKAIKIDALTAYVTGSDSTDQYKVYKTVDGGLTYTFVSDVGGASGTNIFGSTESCIAYVDYQTFLLGGSFHPTKPGTTYGRIYKSTDNCATWSIALDLDAAFVLADSGGLDSSGIYPLSIESMDDYVVLCGMSVKGPINNKSQIFKSTDWANWTTWTSVYKQSAYWTSDFFNLGNGVFLAASSYDDGFSGCGAVLKSIDYGDTWNYVLQLPHTAFPGQVADCVARFARVQNTLYATTNYSGPLLLSSIDNGDNWTVEGLIDDTVTSSVTSVLFSNDKDILICGPSGSGLYILDCNAVACAANWTRTYEATLHNVIDYTLHQAAYWGNGEYSFIYDGLGTYPGKIYRSTGETFNVSAATPSFLIQFSDTVAVAWTLGYFYRTTDKGLTWTEIPTTLRLEGWGHAFTKDHCKCYVNNISFGPDGEGLWYTEDEGLTWQQACFFPGNPAVPTIEQFTITDNGTICFAGWDQYSNIGFFKSTDAGATWTETGFNPDWWQPNAYVACGERIFASDIDPDNENIVYVSDDYGATWTPFITRYIDPQFDYAAYWWSGTTCLEIGKAYLCFIRRIIVDDISKDDQILYLYEISNSGADWSIVLTTPANEITNFEAYNITPSGYLIATGHNIIGLMPEPRKTVYVAQLCQSFTVNCGSPPIIIVPTPYCLGAYQVNLYDTTGKLITMWDNVYNIEIKHQVNGFSSHVLELDDNDARTRLFGLDYIVELVRRIGDYLRIEYQGFHRSYQRQITEGRRELFTSYGRGFVDLLHRVQLGYPAHTSPLTLKGAAGETVIKEFVNENAGPGSTNVLRYTNGQMLGLQIEPNAARGLYWAGMRSNKNLLEVIQEVAKVSGIDFDVVWLGGQNFVFKCFYPNDVSATRAFSPELGNMLQPTFTSSRVDEGTVVIVLGEGIGANRHVVVQQAVTVNDSPWNHIEFIKDDGNAKRYQDYLSSAQAALVDAAPSEVFEFETLQTSVSQYGRDYFLGDIVTARFKDISRLRKLSEVAYQLKEGQENIKLTFSAYP